MYPYSPRTLLLVSIYHRVPETVEEPGAKSFAGTDINEDVWDSLVSILGKAVLS